MSNLEFLSAYVFLVEMPPAMRSRYGCARLNGFF